VKYGLRWKDLGGAFGWSFSLGKKELVADIFSCNKLKTESMPSNKEPHFQEEGEGHASGTLSSEAFSSTSMKEEKTFEQCAQ
jgi:hypothetical protein